MELYLQLIIAKIEDINKMIFDIDDLLPLNETQGHYKFRVMEQLTEARTALRGAVDSMEWYIRKE